MTALVLSWSVAHLAGAQEPATPLSAEEIQHWRDDLRVMASDMERTHKNLFHSISRETFRSRIDALDAAIPQLARHEVIVALSQIVAAIGDGHTNIYPTRDPRVGFHALPVSFTWFGDDLYIRAAHRSQQPLVGARVLRIGDQATTDAYARVKTMIGHDNEQGVRYWAQYLLAMPEVLHALKITRTLDDVSLELATEHGPATVRLRPFESVPVMTGDTATLFDRRDEWIDARDLSGQPEPSWLRHTGEMFHLEHIGSLLYV